MRYYPIFLNLNQTRCLVVGAGQVGVRKIKGLVDQGADRVDVVDLAPPSAELSEWLKLPGVVYHQRTVKDSDLADAFLVIAATSNQEVNRSIAEKCRKQGVLCNVVDQPELCSFIVPATVTRGDLTLAVSTSGASPALARRIRQDLESSFGGHYAHFLLIMGRLRPMMLELGRDTDDNTKTFRALVGSRLLECLEAGDREAAALVLTELLPPELHNRISELVHDLG